MKHIFVGLVLSALPSLVASTFGVDVDARCVAGEPCIVMVADADGKVVNCTLTGSADGGEMSMYALVSADVNAGTDGRSEGDRPIIRIIERVGGSGDKTGGWLGVSIGTVPDALAAQLGIDGRGMVIQNVVTDSPADRAGLQVHDVVLSVNGQELGTDIHSAIEAIKQHSPGDVVNIMVLRNGVNTPVSVTLGSRAEIGSPTIQWKFDGGASAVIEDRLRTRGVFMFKDGDGNWIKKDLGDLDQLDNLPAHIRAFVPKSGTETYTIKTLGDSVTLRLCVKRDGSSINVEQEDGGPIVVERSDAQGIESTATYQTPEELEAGDPEAFEVFDGAGDVRTFTLKLDGLSDLHDVFDMDFDFDWSGDHAEWQDHLAELEVQLEEGLGASREAYEESMAQAERMLEELREKGWVGGDGGPHVFALRSGDGHAFMSRMLRPSAKPKHTFESRADGTIEVRIRKGDSELVQLYANEQDLQRRAPDLYEKYDDLMSLGAE